MTDLNDGIRLIKKYPNRRLYDTQDSKYITLDDAREMVVDGMVFKVVDQKTGEELTRAILLQIIMEQENSGEPLFNTEVLSEFIRNYSDSSRDNFSSFMSESMKMFTQQQAVFMDKMGDAVKGSPMDFWMGMTKKNLDNMQEMQQKFHNPFFNSDTSEDPKS